MSLAKGETYSGDSQRTAFTLDIGNLTGGQEILYSYEVTAYWMGGIPDDFRMDIIRDSSIVHTSTGESDNSTYIVKESGPYKIKWRATTSHNDWKRFDYFVNVTETRELENLNLTVTPLYNPIDVNQGEVTEMSIMIDNINDWPIKIDSVEYSFDFQPDQKNDLEISESPIASSEIYQTMVNVTIPEDALLGETGISIWIEYQALVYDTWYEAEDIEILGLAGPGIMEKDSDGDGYTESNDAFPSDPNEWNDFDGDGAGDNADVFPYDKNESIDSDEDGIGDNTDVFPEDDTEWYDTDNDGVGDNTDAFPKDDSASVDTDGDGFPDEWNQGKTELDTTTGLQLDDYPDNPEKWKKPADSSFILFVAVIMVIMAFTLISRRRRN